MRLPQKFFRDILTGTSGTSFEVIRAGVAWSLVSLTALQTYALVKLGQFSPETFGLAVGAILTAGGAGTLMKDTAKTKADVATAGLPDGTTTTTASTTTTVKSESEAG